MAATQLSSGSVLDSSDPQALFASIYEKFKDALPPGIQKDFAGFKSPSEMLQNFNRLVEDSKSRSGMAGRSLKVTAKLAEKLGPYFEVINIYVQSHPEYAALLFMDLMNTTSAVAALEFYDRWKVHMMHVQLSLDQMQNQQQSQEKENDKILMSK
ncbi:uncharacterized protein K460DRAFT_377572 [Cucurbitaria berberidis CBS 394.84]|uniref:Uncharacterized protein n=1 Tax=Cucurbitaria berberidis CBS 394.84 TaxID=1168544 RepID=A0A9P4L9F9_9PLEO|nr:uncharacterized protein K460DRAFT_377572 [Cucurbitaria berberidis CBS 394.84]KAF1846337.1 hypothetical protein K460DRAFT_377572 [Cucurbitaria berberidis CBS 394.84]